MNEAVNVTGSVHCIVVNRALIIEACPSVDRCPQQQTSSDNFPEDAIRVRMYCMCVDSECKVSILSVLFREG